MNGLKFLAWGFLLCATTVLQAVVRDETPPQTLILAALVVACLTGIWFWFRARG
jgi:hypothetical protein